MRMFLRTAHEGVLDETRTEEGGTVYRLYIQWSNVPETDTVIDKKYVSTAYLERTV